MAATGLSALFPIGPVAIGKADGWRQVLINAAETVQVPNRGPATVKLFMDLWDEKK